MHVQGCGCWASVCAPGLTNTLRRCAHTLAAEAAAQHTLATQRCPPESPPCSCWCRCCSAALCQHTRTGLAAREHVSICASHARACQQPQQTRTHGQARAATPCNPFAAALLVIAAAATSLVALGLRGLHLGPTAERCAVCGEDRGAGTGGGRTVTLWQASIRRACTAEYGARQVPVKQPAHPRAC
jgi:hypothetical protein